MARKKTMTKTQLLSMAGAIASLVALPLGYFYWIADRNPEGNVLSSAGDDSPVVKASGNVSIGLDSASGEQIDAPTDREKSAAPNLDGASAMTSQGDRSPVVEAGGDVTINFSEVKPDFVTDHNGAGALLMTEPDFEAFIGSTFSDKGEKVVGRLINGTEVAKIEVTSADVPRADMKMPWAKVRILEGDLKGKEGWILMNSLRRP